MKLTYHRLPLLLLLLSCLFLTPALAQSPDYEAAVKDYIDLYKDIAIREMNQYGIPASITLAQGIIESNAGRSTLARKANNHFGIKCHNGWTGGSYYMDDDKPNECFRKYGDPKESFCDHSLFLTSRDRYKSLFALQTNDYKGWARGLKSAGYATNPQYADLLIKTIERFSLDKFDSGYTPGVPVPPAPEAVLASAFSKMKTTYFAPGPGGRKTYTNNHTWMVITAPGEDLRDISCEFDIPVRKLYRYNDLKIGENIHDGDPVYLAKKRGRSEVKVHKVEKGQTMWQIAQIYGVKMHRLCLRNGIEPGQEPQTGQILRLR